MPNQPNQPQQPTPPQQPPQPAQEQRRRPDASGEKKTPASSATNYAAALTNAFVDMTKGHQEAALEYQKRCHNAYFQMVAQLQQAAAAAQKPFEEAQRKLMSAAEAAQQNKEKMQDYQNAYQEFASSYGGQPDTQFQEAFRKAHETFQQTQREAVEAARRQSAESYQKFVRALKGVWGEIDPQNVDPDTLRLIEWATRVAAAARV